MMILCLKSLLHSQGGKFVSRFSLFRTMSGNRKRWCTFQGYLSGAIRSGFIQTYEYIPKKGSICLGLTDKGNRLIDIYTQAYKKAISRVQKTGKFKNAHLYRPIDIYY